MTKRKAALGKGLGALLPDSESEYPAGSRDPESRLYNFEDRIRTSGKISDIAVDRISPNPFQPRENFDEAALEELAQSIRHLGIIQPLTVRSRGPNQYELISGERRLRAASLAGLERVPAFVREADTEAMLEMAIVENVQREQLNPIEISLGYRRLMDECGLTQEQVAEKVGKSRPAVANYLRLLNLPPVIQAGLRDGYLSIGHARALLSLGSDALQQDVLDAIVQKGLSVRDTESMVKRLASPGSKKKTTASESESIPRHIRLELDRITDRIRSRLGTKVSIKPSTDGRTGRIEVEYYSAEDLERLADLLADD
ncbi:MAG: chromosome partitioning protein ParB [Bacteroidetes bacterium CG12_big_fil_rev_8_21_14_0_65_60_17]|nr:MAG: chromosome partitioning protein ParB [Bacteroidetes bacterium CG12_big_fil_rev_8_21_14_0_65_60_17]